MTTNNNFFNICIFYFLAFSSSNISVAPLLLVNMASYPRRLGISSNCFAWRNYYLTEMAQSHALNLWKSTYSNRKRGKLLGEQWALACLQGEWLNHYSFKELILNPCVTKKIMLWTDNIFNIASITCCNMMNNCITAKVNLLNTHLPPKWVEYFGSVQYPPQSCPNRTGLIFRVSTLKTVCMVRSYYHWRAWRIRMYSCMVTSLGQRL
jgi:hypothetical protein